MTDRGCERSCRLVTLRRDESDFQPSLSCRRCRYFSAPPAVPCIGETFQSGLHERSIPCIIREQFREERETFHSIYYRIVYTEYPVHLDKTILSSFIERRKFSKETNFRRVKICSIFRGKKKISRLQMV